MYTLGADFSAAGSQAILSKIASGFDLTSNGDSVLIFSRIVKVYQADCDAAAVTCTNLNKTVFSQRIVIGKASLRSSSFGTPPAQYINSAGNIAPSRLLPPDIARGKWVRFGNTAAARGCGVDGRGVFHHAQLEFPESQQRARGVLCTIRVLIRARRRRLRQRGFAVIVSAMMLLLVIMPAAGLGGGRRTALSGSGAFIGGRGCRFVGRSASAQPGLGRFDATVERPERWRKRISTRISRRIISSVRTFR